jgi:hypothetical protein
MVVIDRDEESYDVGLSRPGFRPTVSDHTLGDHYFARLRFWVEPLSAV